MVVEPAPPAGEMDVEAAPPVDDIDVVTGPPVDDMEISHPGGDAEAAQTDKGVKEESEVQLSPTEVKANNPTEGQANLNQCAPGFENCSVETKHNLSLDSSPNVIEESDPNCNVRVDTKLSKEITPAVDGNSESSVVPDPVWNQEHKTEPPDNLVGEARQMEGSSPSELENVDAKPGETEVEPAAEDVDPAADEPAADAEAEATKDNEEDVRMHLVETKLTFVFCAGLAHVR